MKIGPDSWLSEDGMSLFVKLASGVTHVYRWWADTWHGPYKLPNR